MTCPTYFLTTRHALLPPDMHSSHTFSLKLKEMCLLSNNSCSYCVRGNISEMCFCLCIKRFFLKGHRDLTTFYFSFLLSVTSLRIRSSQIHRRLHFKLKRALKRGISCAAPVRTHLHPAWVGCALFP